MTSEGFKGRLKKKRSIKRWTYSLKIYKTE